MKVFISLIALVGFASAAFNGAEYKKDALPIPYEKVESSDHLAQIKHYENGIANDGNFDYLVKTDNGIYAQAKGSPRNFGGDPPVAPVVIKGEFSYTSPEGKQIDIGYFADENGYQPYGDSIPTAPPVPEAIVRALEYLAKFNKQK